MGASGSGKSTLLNILGLLDRPSFGRYRLDGLGVQGAANDALADLRNHKIGFVFQAFHLLSRLSALDNVAHPLLYRGLSKRERRSRAEQELVRVGLADRLHHKPEELSGGQRQRVAVARALVGSPSLVLADEPTGNLDTASTADIIDLLERMNHTLAVTVVVVTHEVSGPGFAGGIQTKGLGGLGAWGLGGTDHRPSQLDAVSRGAKRCGRQPV